MLSFTTQFAEKLGEQSGAFSLKNALHDHRAMVKSRLLKQIHQGACAAGFGVSRAVDDLRNAGLYNRTGTHRTGLQGDVQAAIQQTPGSERAAGLTDSYHLRMGGCIEGGLAKIEAAPYNFISADNDGPDRDLTAFFCFCASLMASCIQYIC